VIDDRFRVVVLSRHSSGSHKEGTDARHKSACCYLRDPPSAAAQSVDPPLSETRLTVNTLLREDVFAGWMDNDLNRLQRGERNIEVLLQQRPAERATLIAWRAGATLYRAVLAHKNGTD
jgi:hypothetical protein